MYVPRVTNRVFKQKWKQLVLNFINRSVFQDWTSSKTVNAKQKMYKNRNICRALYDGNDTLINYINFTDNDSLFEFWRTFRHSKQICKIAMYVWLLDLSLEICLQLNIHIPYTVSLQQILSLMYFDYHIILCI